MNSIISSQQQRKIEAIITRWSGSLTWDKLVKRIQLELDLKISRQSLCTYVGIYSSYKKKKSELRGAIHDGSANTSQSQVKLADQVERLKAEILVLERHNAEQLRMIERILSNASAIPNLDLYALVRKRPEEIRDS